MCWKHGESWGCASRTECCCYLVPRNWKFCWGIPVPWFAADHPFNFANHLLFVRLFFVTTNRDLFTCHMFLWNKQGTKRLNYRLANLQPIHYYYFLGKKMCWCPEAMILWDKPILCTSQIQFLKIPVALHRVTQTQTRGAGAEDCLCQNPFSKSQSIQVLLEATCPGFLFTAGGPAGQFMLWIQRVYSPCSSTCARLLCFLLLHSGCAEASGNECLFCVKNGLCF